MIFGTKNKKFNILNI